jgi:hypothetical protein
MSLLVTVADFTGYYILNFNTANTPIIQDYIDRYEKQYILDLLGVELGLLFIADLANVSQDVRFTVLQEPFDLTHNEEDQSSRGMVDYLTAMILYEYVSSRQAKPTDNGIARDINEAQTIVSPTDAARYAANKFNEAIDTVEAIRWYCKVYAPATYPSTPERLYPEFNGKVIEPVFAPFL